MNGRGTFVIIAVSALLSVAGTAYAGSQLSMIGSQWQVYEQVTLPNGGLNFYPAGHATTMPSGGVEVAFPDASGSKPAYVNYIRDTYTASLSESDSMTAKVNIVTTCPDGTTPCATTKFVGNPDGVIPGSSVRLFMLSNLPSTNSTTCVGHGVNENNYWWSNPTSYKFVDGGSDGPLLLSVSLDPSNWSNICGKFGSSDPAAFDASIANIKEVGLSFGSGYFFANGVGVDGSTGSAMLELLNYTIR